MGCGKRIALDECAMTIDSRAMSGDDSPSWSIDCWWILHAPALSLCYMLRASAETHADKIHSANGAKSAHLMRRVFHKSGALFPTWAMLQPRIITVIIQRAAFASAAAWWIPITESDDLSSAHNILATVACGLWNLDHDHIEVMLSNQQNMCVQLCRPKLNLSYKQFQFVYLLFLFQYNSNVG